MCGAAIDASQRLSEHLDATASRRLKAGDDVQSVDFPQPLGPTIETKVPAATFSVTPSTAYASRIA